MEKLITVLFKSDEDAFKASQAINGLEENGDVSVSELYIVSKDGSGELVIKNAKNEVIPYTAAGALTGGIIGILGGPLGVLIGFTAGSLAGGLGDLISLSQSSKFLKKASQSIPQGKTAIVANIDEYWETPLDTVLKPFETKVQRLNVDEEIDKYIIAQQKEIDTKIEALKEDVKTATSEQKEKIQAKLDELKEKRAAFNLHLKEKSEIEKKRIPAWFDNLKNKFTNLKNEVKHDVSEGFDNLKEEAEEILVDIRRGMNLLEEDTRESYNKSIDYIKEKVEELDEDIEELENKIEQVADEDKEKLEVKLTELKAKRNDLLASAKAQVEKQRAEFSAWVDEAQSRLESYGEIIKEKSEGVKHDLEEYKKSRIHKQIAYHQQRIKSLEEKL